MPLRFPRPVAATMAIGVAVAWAAIASVPALADGARPATTADQVRQQEWWLGKLHFTQAWQTTKGRGVTIALLDTGVDAAVPDLAGSVISGPDLTNSGAKTSAQPAAIHGTAMASLIVGHGHGSGNGNGVLGVAPQAKLLSVRVTLDAGDPALSDSAITSGLPDAIAAGIRYAVANGAQVIDLPLDPGQAISALTATPAPTTASAATPAAAVAAAAAAAGGSAAEQSAVAFALSKGVILVAPGGDNNATTDAVNFPADYPGVISVGAFDSATVKAPFSSHQSYVTLTAAGSGMIAAVPSGGYATVSSTSAASAVVTGIAALIKSQYPELTPAQVTDALKNGTVFHRPGGQATGSGAGTADAAKALTAAGTVASPGPSRAGAQAVSNPMPAAPAPPVVSNALTKKLYRDGLISLIVLAVLLVPALAYVARVRRRVRTVKQARAEVSPAARVPYAHNAASDADLMNEYFAPIVGDPDSPGAEPRIGAAAASSASGGLLARSVMSATRLPVTHPPEVSGTPPWEPAPKPDSELPWASRSLPSRPRRNMPAHLLSAPTRARHGEPAAAAAGLAATSTDQGAGLYVWSPGSTTESISPAGGGGDAGPGSEQNQGDGQPTYRDEPGYRADGPPSHDDLAASPGGGQASYSGQDLTSHRDADLPAYGDQAAQGDPATYRDQASYPDQAVHRDQPAYRDPATYRDDTAYPDQAEYRDQASYPDQAVHRDQPAYPDQAAYRDHAVYPDQADYRDQTGYLEQTAYGERASYPDQTAYRDGSSSADQPAYRDQPAYGNLPTYGDQAEYRDQPDYADQPAYSDQPGHRDEPGYTDQPAYRD